MASRTQSSSKRPVLRPDRSGYEYRGDSFDGFADREDLALADRQRLARWAKRFTSKDVSGPQEELLRQAAATPPAASEQQREFLANQHELQQAYLQDLFSHLSGAQRHWVSDPGTHPKLAGRTYPLTVGDLEVLTGANARQIRKWADDGLIPSFRDGNDRRFYSAALVRAMVLADAPQYEKSALIAVAQGKGDRLLRLLYATIEPMVEQSAGVMSGALKVGGVTSPLASLGPSKPKQAAEPSDRVAWLSTSVSRAHVDGVERVREEVKQLRLVAPHDAGGWALRSGPTQRVIRRCARKAEAITLAKQSLIKQGGGVVVVREKNKVRRIDVAAASARTR